MIRPDERALAVAVDEVINAGGQLTPGDYVDVLLFLRMDNLNLQPSAQLAIPALRVLGVGEQLGLTNDGQPSSPPRATMKNSGRSNSAPAPAPYCSPSPNHC